MCARRLDLAPALPRIRLGLGQAAVALRAVLEVGCARESLPIAMVPAPPLQGPLPSLWQLPPQLARIPPPVAPYVWPDPLQPLPKLEVPQWAGVAAAPFAATVQRAAMYYQLPADLIWAVIKVESNFREQAVSRAGARGLMQLMPRTARAIGLRDPLDPEQNILGGAYYLRRLANRFGGDIYFTLAAYNAGPGAVRRHGGIPPFPETRDYIRKVLLYYANSTPTPL
jgi:soluble lytic murein transglycosylase-like protein